MTNEPTPENPTIADNEAIYDEQIERAINDASDALRHLWNRRAEPIAASTERETRLTVHNCPCPPCESTRSRGTHTSDNAHSGLGVVSAVLRPHQRDVDADRLAAYDHGGTFAASSTSASKTELFDCLRWGCCGRAAGNESRTWGSRRHLWCSYNVADEDES